LIGPWSHQTIGKSQLGPYDFGEYASVDINHQRLIWMDFWLKGINNEIADEALVKLFAVGPNEWLEMNSYPGGTDKLELFLAADDNKGNDNFHGKLSLENNSSRIASACYTYDPAVPTPPLWYDNFPQIDSITKNRKDLLVFETAPLETGCQVIGPVSATIYASSTASDTDWIVYYFVIDENNELQPVMGRGNVRAKYRDIENGVGILEKNKIYKYELDLWHSSFQLQQGYKIRIVVCSAAFPHFSRNLNTGKDNETTTDFISTEQKIWFSDKYPSSISFSLMEQSK